MAYLDWSQGCGGRIEERVLVEANTGRANDRTNRHNHEAQCDELAQPSEEEISSLAEEGCILVKP